MTARHIVRAAAELEIVRALDYYAINAPGKLADFESAIDAVMERLTEAPRRYRERVGDIRCAFVQGFPYQIWYVWRESLQVVDVVAFLHGRQDRSALPEHRGTG